MRKKLEGEKNELKIIIFTKIQSIIMRNTLTILKMPKIFGDDLYETETLGDQILRLMKSSNSHELVNFLEDGIEMMVRNEGKGNRPIDVLKGLFGKVHKEIQDLTLSNIMLSCETLELLTLIASKKQLGLELVNSSFPADRKNGKLWENTLLGSLLAISVINKPGRKPDFFAVNAASLLISDYKINEQNAFSNADLVSGFIFRIWENLFKGGAQSKHAGLEWIAQCLHANKGRKSEMANHGGKCTCTPRLHSSSILKSCCLHFLIGSSRTPHS